jgi:hypothetical protein
LAEAVVLALTVEAAVVLVVIEPLQVLPLQLALHLQ